jgi:hypothetical protein
MKNDHRAIVDQETRHTVPVHYDFRETGGIAGKAKPPMFRSLRPVISVSEQTDRAKQ